MPTQYSCPSCGAILSGRTAPACPQCHVRFGGGVKEGTEQERLRRAREWRRSRPEAVRARRKRRDAAERIGIGAFLVAAVGGGVAVGGWAIPAMWPGASMPLAWVTGGLVAVAVLAFAVWSYLIIFKTSEPPGRLLLPMATLWVASIAIVAFARPSPEDTGWVNYLFLFGSLLLFLWTVSLPRGGPVILTLLVWMVWMVAWGSAYAFQVGSVAVGVTGCAALVVLLLVTSGRSVLLLEQGQIWSPTGDVGARAGPSASPRLWDLHEARAQVQIAIDEHAAGTSRGDLDQLEQVRDYLDEEIRKLGSRA